MLLERVTPAGSRSKRLFEPADYNVLNGKFSHSYTSFDLFGFNGEPLNQSIRQQLLSLAGGQ